MAKRGRKRVPAAQRRSKNRTFRVRGDLDGKLQAAAKANGRSVSEEIEFRLIQSFDAMRVIAVVDAAMKVGVMNALRRDHRLRPAAGA